MSRNLSPALELIVVLARCSFAVTLNGTKVPF
jgi:hypothetical protein